MSDPTIISVVPKGTPTIPATSSAISDIESGTGQIGTTTKTAGLLFADERELGQAVRDLLLRQCGDKPTFVFTAPVQIEVRSNEPPDLSHLKLWLIRAARLYMDRAHSERAAERHAMVLLSINWLDMTKRGGRT